MLSIRCLYHSVLITEVLKYVLASGKAIFSLFIFSRNLYNHFVSLKIISVCLSEQFRENWQLYNVDFFLKTAPIHFDL